MFKNNIDKLLFIVLVFIILILVVLWRVSAIACADEVGQHCSPISPTSEYIPDVSPTPTFIPSDTPIQPTLSPAPGPTAIPPTGIPPTATPVTGSRATITQPKSAPDTGRG